VRPEVARLTVVARLQVAVMLKATARAEVAVKQPYRQGRVKQKMREQTEKSSK
jgi:hypothetical protein